MTFWKHDKRSIRERKRARNLTEERHHLAWNEQYKIKLDVLVNEIPTVFIGMTISLHETTLLIWYFRPSVSGIQWGSRLLPWACWGGSKWKGSIWEIHSAAVEVFQRGAAFLLQRSLQSSKWFLSWIAVDENNKCDGQAGKQGWAYLSDMEWSCHTSFFFALSQCYLHPHQRGRENNIQKRNTSKHWSSLLRNKSRMGGWSWDQWEGVSWSRTFLWFSRPD